jgi:hypothetical protein
LDLVPDLCKGIRAMPVVCQHPDWWFTLLFDGFGSHLGTKALKIFADYKIQCAKEEGDSSDTNQAYNQLVAKADKRILRESLDKARGRISGIINQKVMIGLVIRSLSQVPSKTWVESFVGVNLHPDRRIPFEEWLKKIDSKIQIGERFFKVRNRSLFDAMPALWKQMTEIMRQMVVDTIKGFYQDPGDSWSRENTMKLIQFVPLGEIGKLRPCYFAAKRYPRVIQGNGSELPAVAEPATHEPFKYAVWNPKCLLVAYVSNKQATNPERQKQDTKMQCEYFHHITPFVARNHKPGPTNRASLVPSSWLGLDVSLEQENLLNPTFKDVILGNLMHETMGEGAKKKIATRRLDMIEGNIGSYSWILNSPAQLKAIADQNELNAVIAALMTEQEEKKKERKEKKTKEAKEKEQKQDELKAQFAIKKATVMPGLLWEEIAKGRDHVASLNNSKLKDILIYFFPTVTKGVKTMNKSKLVDELLGRWAEVEPVLGNGADEAADEAA